MLTPAEEMGLSGLSLASRVRMAFTAIPGPEVVKLLHTIRQECERRHLFYLRDGQPDVIHLLPIPLTMLPLQLTYIHSVCLTIHNALKRLPEVYLNDPQVRDLLRITPEEEAWLTECWGPSHQEHNPVFGRLDAMVDFTSPMWKDSLRFVEPNMSGIGGLQMMPNCEEIMREVVLPILEAIDPQLRLQVGQDMRELLLQEVLDHLEAIGRFPRTLCFVEPKYAGSGPDEQEGLTRYIARRHGLQVFHADPTELESAGEEVCYRGTPIDLVYRDYTVADLLALEREGHDVGPMRRLFRQNRVMSSIAAELDQKACWEILTDPRLARRLYTSDERQIFRRHILWTRILSERRTTLPDGREEDLLKHTRREREGLVLKPNRSYGGEGVVIGPSVTQAEWEAAIDRALGQSERWVVQQLATIPLSEFPVLDPDGRRRLEPFYTVMGFAPTKFGLAILGRASQRQVVNVAQRGGMCAVMIGQPVGALVGPRAPSAALHAPA
jgi:hypothetical protein